MTKVIWGSLKNKKSTPIIRGAKKCGNNEFVIPLLRVEVIGIQFDAEIVSQFIRSLCDGGVDVVVDGVNSLTWLMESQRIEISMDCIIGRTTRAWLEDGIIYAVILFNDRPEAIEYANMLENETDYIGVFVPYICRFPDFEIQRVNRILPIVSLNKMVLNQSVENEDRSMTVTMEQLEPVADKIVTPAVMRSIAANNSVLNNESIILRGIVPTEDGKALLIRIPELNNRRVFIGSKTEYEVLYVDASGRAAITSESELFEHHKSQVSETSPYKLEYSGDKVTIWFVNGNSVLDNVLPVKRKFKPVTLIEMFGGKPYLDTGVSGQFCLPSCCGFKNNDVITVNDTRVHLVRIGISSGFAVFEAAGEILENLKEARKVAEPFGDERSLIIVKRTDENRVEITVSQPMVAKTK